MFAIANLLFEDDDEEMQVDVRRMHLHRKQFIRDTSDPFTMGERVFKKHYRMPPHIAIHLIEMLRPHLVDHSQGIPVHFQVLSVLRFLAEGSYQKGVAQDCYHPMSQSSFSKYLHQVIEAIVHFADEYIVFPRNLVERQELSARYF